MNTCRDSLDEAIDRVASRLTHVEDSPELAARIVASLPMRASWFDWFTQSWAPRLAMLAVIVTGAVIWMRFDAPAIQPQVARLASVPRGAAMANVVARPEPLERWNPVRTRGVEPLEPLEPLEPDFERSLPQVMALKEIGIEALAPADLPAGRSIDIAPLTIGDLPLSGETFSPR